MQQVKIPAHLPEFKTPTLLFVSDTTRAKWYFLNGKILSRLGGFEHKKPEYTDLKGHYNIDEVERHDMDLFAKAVAEKIQEEAKKVKAKHIIISVPQRIKNRFIGHLPDAFRKKIIREHDANLYRFNGLEVLKVLYK